MQSSQISKGKERKSLSLPVLISDGLGTKGSKSQGDGQTDDRTVADKEIPINAVSESGNFGMILYVSLLPEFLEHNQTLTCHSFDHSALHYI
ncbi:hypothetical protein OIU77_017878 [Salix suchowensis]|uniref:Uncharacterized protein n=1 Tax=Salix suchowensis TaxID=1278906 RepID=A0ABQ8ZQY8_9ROSI|nr:hypothetical protein OIU77_017878 [Salix suchowensis]